MNFDIAFLAASTWGPRPQFEKKHGTIERWIWCTCDECVTARAPLDQALAEERARREAPPSWHAEVEPCS